MLLLNIGDDMWWLVMRIYENWWVTVCGSRCISKRCSKVKVGKVGKRRAHEMHGMLCHFLSTWCWAWSLSKGPKSVCADVSPITSVQIAWKKKLWLRLVLLQFISVQTASLQENKHWNPSTSFLWIQFANYYMRAYLWYILIYNIIMYIYIYNTGACDWRMMHNVTKCGQGVALHCTWLEWWLYVTMETMAANFGKATYP